MDRKPGPFDTVGISGREYNKITDENAALRARVARLEEALATIKCWAELPLCQRPRWTDVLDAARRPLEEK